MGRHRHKKVSDKDAEENITKQLVESGKKEELKIMVLRKFSAVSFVRCCAPLQVHFSSQLTFSLNPLVHNKHTGLLSVLVIENFDFFTFWLITIMGKIRDCWKTRHFFLDHFWLFAGHCSCWIVNTAPMCKIRSFPYQDWKRPTNKPYSISWATLKAVLTDDLSRHSRLEINFWTIPALGFNSLKESKRVFDLRQSLVGPPFPFYHSYTFSLGPSENVHCTT